MVNPEGEQLLGSQQLQADTLKEGGVPRATVLYVPPSSSWARIPTLTSCLRCLPGLFEVQESLIPDKPPTRVT